jgi:hypothetical protein
VFVILTLQECGENGTKRHVDRMFYLKALVEEREFKTSIRMKEIQFINCVPTPVSSYSSMYSASVGTATLNAA